MKSFDIHLAGKNFTVTPDEHIKGVYRVLLDQQVHKVIQEDEDENWQELDQETFIPISMEYDPYINKLGEQIEERLRA